MNCVIALDRIADRDRPRVGGKAHALGRLLRAGLAVPDGVCVTVEAYRAYVARTRLREKILLEINRKRFDDLRWEEMWDSALRIRNLFLNTLIPSDLGGLLLDTMAKRFGDRPVAVRSSAPGEDAAHESFAGLHESFVNVRGPDEILKRVRLVWASLWSDAALLYRREMNLEAEDSAMAVVVQEFLDGDASGVAFTRDPNNAAQAMVEAVHGLNQAMVDGTVAPDRWILDRATGHILSHVPADREKAMRLRKGGVELVPLDAATAGAAPVSPDEVLAVYKGARGAERLFGAPQDVEWTFVNSTLHLLQSRAITTGGGDERTWYLTLRRSFENLKALRARIEDDLIPAMLADASALAARPVIGLPDEDLAEEIEHRAAVRDKWHHVYYDEFIPFAHGMRFFGQVYNDVVSPEDPYEFADLLRPDNMLSLDRNRRLSAMAEYVRARPDLTVSAAKLEGATDEELEKMLATFMKASGEAGCFGADPKEARKRVLGVVFEMARKAAAQPSTSRAKDLERVFLERMGPDHESEAREILDLGRASYRLRDDDNLYLGRVDHQAALAEDEARARLARRGRGDASAWPAEELAKALREPAYVPPPASKEPLTERSTGTRARQLVGQPAGAGIAVGCARVIRENSDLFEFKAGEILVCDAIQPDMTFLAPLASAVVERRGGMLIHGAIIAREYGLPCVTGVPEATRRIRTGDRLTVDGYLGIVIDHSGTELAEGV